MRSLLAATAMVLSAAACGDTAPSSSPPPPTPPTSSPTPETSELSTRSFGEFATWARPIEDYVDKGKQMGGEFQRGIHSLAAHAGRLHVGYGDANSNMGEHIPIAFRSFRNAADPASISEDFASSEEQLDRFRVLDGVLWQAGIDANDKDELSVRPLIKGNVYRLDDAGWVKHRSIFGGEHVHDVAFFHLAVFAVGSGADNRTEWEGGQIFRYLWTSTDGGVTFRTFAREVNTAGDTRWTQLLATPDVLYLFGYASMNAGGGSLKNAQLLGDSVQPLPPEHGLASIFAFHTDSLPDGTGLVRGEDIRETGARRVHTWHVKKDGSVHRVEALEGFNVVDVSVVKETSEVILLVHDGSKLDVKRTSFTTRVLVAPLSNLEAVTVIREPQTMTVAPRSIAYFDNALFLGNDAGEILKASHP